MVLIMACELTFSTPTERGTFPNCQTAGCGAGVATGRWARRHAAPAVVGRFAFFSRLGLVLETDSGFAGHGQTADDETGLTPGPHSKNGKSPKFYRQRISMAISIIINWESTDSSL